MNATANAAINPEREVAPNSVAKDALSYLALAFAFAWITWIAAIKLHLSEPWLNIGTAGPALAAMALSFRRPPIPAQGKTLRWAWFLALVAMCWIVLSLHYEGRGADKFELRLDPLLLIPAMLPAWVVSGALSRDSGVRALLRRLVHRPGRWPFYAFFSFPVFMLIPAGIVHLFGGALVWPGEQGAPLVLVARAAVFLGYNILFVAVLEEPGWRGFLLDRLQSRIAPLWATLLVWLPWALWHGPLDYFRPTPFTLTNWLLIRVVFLIPLAIILTWFYNRSGRSIQATALFHASMNTFPFVLPYSMPAFGLLFVWAGYAVVDGKMWRRAVKSAERLPTRNMPGLR